SGFQTRAAVAWRARGSQEFFGVWCFWRFDSETRDSNTYFNFDEALSASRTPREAGSAPFGRMNQAEGSGCSKSDVCAGCRSPNVCPVLIGGERLRPGSWAGKARPEPASIASPEGR
ncbi:MAG: hypothetical protein AAF296_03995, partial [Pseudomonadota bacterium]